MKKRMIALLLLVTLSATACGEGAGSVSGNDRDGHSRTRAERQYSDDEIEDRIKEIGEAYDGLYSYDYEYDMVMCETACDEEALVGAPKTGEVQASAATSNSRDMSYGAPDYLDPGYMEPVEWNTENYNSITENGFVSVATQPFSTFGADVDTATYSNFRRSVYQNDGYGISGDAIRAEEMINYFSYDYPEADDGEKFSVTTALTPCPWNDDTMLLRVGIRAEEIAPTAGSNIVFLIDTSGSMFDSNKLPLAQEAFKMLQKNLTKNDTISIVTYAGNEEVVLEGAKGSDHQDIIDAIDSLEAWGSTNGEGGIRKAYEIAEKYFIEGGNNRVILATDGDLNVGISSEAGLIELVEEERETGVFLSCLGFGNGNYQDAKMEALADHGNGNYAFIDCTAEAQRVLQDELWSTLYTVAKDVKFQVEFNPAQVRGYRLIGYENRAMAAEDFADDTKDGGEVGSGQTVTVLYEVVTNDSDYEIPEVESRYGNDAVGNPDSDELLTVSIRYKEPDEDQSQLITCPVTMDMYSDEMDDDTSWAAGVAQFAMLLRDSDYAGTSTYQEIYDRLKTDPKVMSDDFCAEFLYMIGKVAENQ